MVGCNTIKKSSRSPSETFVHTKIDSVIAYREREEEKKKKDKMRVVPT